MKNVKSVGIVTHTHTHTHTNKKEKGITLIALIITVILLLILAGVAINFALGENGILKGAEYAVDKYQNKAEQEQNELAKVDDYIQGNRQTEKVTNYNISETLELESSVDHIDEENSYIKKYGNVVDMQLLVYFKSNIQANTFVNIAKLNKKELIPNKTVWEISIAGANLGNAQITQDGFITIRHSNSTYAYYIRLTYIVD